MNKVSKHTNTASSQSEQHKANNARCRIIDDNIFIKHLLLGWRNVTAAPALKKQSDSLGEWGATIKLQGKVRKLDVRL